MNVLRFLRRLYLILLSLMFIVVLTILLLSPGTVAGWAGSVSEISLVVRVLLAALLVVGLLALTYVQVRSDPRSNVSGLVMRGSGAVTEVSVESARERILKAVSDVPDVVSAEAQVKPVEGRADVELQVVVMGHDVKLPVKQKEINRALKQVIDKQLGLRMAGQPRIHIRLHNEQSTRQPSVSSPAPIASPKIEPVPPSKVEEPAIESRSKPFGGLFGGLRQGNKEEDDVGSDDAILLPGKPSSSSTRDSIATPVKSSPTVSDDEDDRVSIPSISSLFSRSSSDDSDEDEDGDDTVKLDLDKELVTASTEDITPDDLPDPIDDPEANERSDSDEDATDENDRSPFA